MCLNYKSEKEYVDAVGKPTKRSKTGGAKGSVAMLKESFQVVVYLNIFIRENLFYVNRKNWDIAKGEAKWVIACEDDHEEEITQFDGEIVKKKTITEISHTLKHC